MGPAGPAATPAAAVADIADPATATPEALATQFNTLLANLRTAGLLST